MFIRKTFLFKKKFVSESIASEKNRLKNQTLNIDGNEYKIVDRKKHRIYKCLFKSTKYFNYRRLYRQIISFGIVCILEKESYIFVYDYIIVS